MARKALATTPQVPVAKNKTELIEQAERVQTLLLANFERILLEGTAKPTDLATIARYLMQNNFRVDANQMPRALADLVAETRLARGNKPRVLPRADDLTDVQ